MLRFVFLVFVGGCAASPPPTAPEPPPAAPPPAPPPDQSQAIEQERARRDELATAHRARLDEQATALAATCEQPADEPVEQRCLPSCYAPEVADSRAKKKSARAVEIMHIVCTRSDAGPYLLADELGGAKLELRPVRGRPPKPGKQGTWQAEVETAATASLEPEIGRGDVVRVTGAWKQSTHPVTRERLRCVTVSHYTRSVRRALDDCGSQGAIACEAMRNPAAHGINVVHYRLLEARRLHADGKSNECQKAALEAIAVARGMPRWRQYMTLNTELWKPFKRYRTRFDGILDEDTLFSTAIALGVEAEGVYASCGGSSPKTTATQEQSFHTCW